jgi:hypothetical protein
MLNAAYFPDSPKPINGPLCPKCGVAMLIIRIEAMGLGYALQTFECHECQFEEMKVVKRA